jgi:adiponectin receptor
MKLRSNNKKDNKMNENNIHNRVISNDDVSTNSSNDDVSTNSINFEDMEELRKGIFNLPEPKSSKHADPYFINPYMNEGYRVHYNMKDCLCSIFSLHNETFNIWTHLLPLLFIIFYVFRIMVDLLHGSKDIDKIMVSFYFVGSTIALAGSVIYHTFSCISRKSHDVCLCFDMGGCLFLMLGFMYPCVYFAFYCDETLRIIYIALTTFIMITGLFIVINSNHPQYGLQLRLKLFPVLGALGLVPMFHIYLYSSSKDWNLYWVGYLNTFYLAAMGFIIYTIRFPEKYFPKFVEFTHIYSHSIWHLFVVGVIAVGYYQIFKIVKWIKVYEC